MRQIHCPVALCNLLLELRATVVVTPSVAASYGALQQRRARCGRALSLVLKQRF